MAEATRKSETEFLPKEEEHDNKKYKTMVGPRKGKYYKVNSGNGWGPWNNYTGKHPWESQLSDYLKDKFILEIKAPVGIVHYLKENFA